MPLSAFRDSKLDRMMPHQHSRAHVLRLFMASLIMLSLLAFGCSDASKRTAANSPGDNANSNAGSPVTSRRPTTADIKEPERYSVAMTITIPGAASGAPALMLTPQLSLAKLGADRRWTFVFPAPVGQIVYLEKSGLKYLVIFERKLYAELSADDLGFAPGSVLMPHSIADRFKTGRYEKIGLEPVNGRTAIKYRVTGAGGAATQTDGMIFVDEQTGLPLRSELNVASSSGTKSRVIVEVNDLQLNPDRAQFDVPAGMKKVTSKEVKQQIETVAGAIRTFADIISETPSTPAAKANQSVVNRNAARSRQ